MPRKKIDKLTAFVKDYGAKGLAYVALQEDGTVKSSFAKIHDRRADGCTCKSYGWGAGRSASLCS